MDDSQKIELTLKQYNELVTKAESNSLTELRGQSLQAYHSLERSLCHVFAHAGKIDGDVASIIFFKITASRVRDAIIEKLMKKRYGNTYSVFWKSALPFMDHLSHTRNEIVHWSVAEIALVGTGMPNIVRLVHPNLVSIGQDPKPKSPADLQDFIEKCNFVTGLCSTFVVLLQAPHVFDNDPAMRQTWIDIFQQPMTYPPPSSHPLYRTTSAPGNQPPPSQASPPPAAT